jgi:hypothetical protein
MARAIQYKTQVASEYSRARIQFPTLKATLTDRVDQFFCRADASGTMSPLSDGLGSNIALRNSFFHPKASQSTVDNFVDGQILKEQ